jgi:hypothetical protein
MAYEGNKQISKHKNKNIYMTLNAIEKRTGLKERSS